jgi:hypothetical protein
VNGFLISYFSPFVFFALIIILALRQFGKRYSSRADLAEEHKNFFSHDYPSFLTPILRTDRRDSLCFSPLFRIAAGWFQTACGHPSVAGLRSANQP